MIRVQPTKTNHVYWMDLHNDGILTECAVMKKDKLDNYYFIEVSNLDSIDHKRLHKIVNNINADRLELWDIMSQVTLGNGVNALTYFQQVVRMVTANGQIVDPNSGKLGFNIDAMRRQASTVAAQPAPTKETAKSAPAKK